MQSDKKPPANKLAMSRALGAAFLSHQVEQLEKSVGRESRGATSNNWRERNGQTAAGRGTKRGGVPHAHQSGRKRERKDGDRNEIRESGKPRERKELSGGREEERDADTVVVDASVLVHALGQVKKWCRDGRHEEIVIPLEALNTLDIFKKGSTPLAQRARAASRILEAQVGTNPRIRVQRDDAFVLWDDVPFSASNPTSSDPPLSDAKPEPTRPGNIPAGLTPPPEWLRRTICCGTWEVANAAVPPPSSSLALPASSAPARSSTPTSSVAPSSDSAHAHPEVRPRNAANVLPSTPATTKKVVLAVLAPGHSPSSSLETGTFNPGRYERADGSLVRLWAQRAGIEVLDVEPTAVPGPGPPTAPLSPHHAHASPEKRRPLGAERRDRDHKDGERERKPSLVEKPIAMTIVNDQPVKVLRVLARGEKLEP